MFETFFGFIRGRFADAILGGFHNASDELAGKLEAEEPIRIEAEPTTNGSTKPKARRKAGSR